MRTWTWFIGGIVLALVCVWALAHVLPSGLEWIPIALYAVIIFSSGMGSLLVRKSLERRTRTGDANSIERDLALNARSDSFTALLIMNIGVGAYLINADITGAGVASLGIAVLGVAWFWIRCARLRSAA